MIIQRDIPLERGNLVSFPKGTLQELLMIILNPDDHTGYVSESKILRQLGRQLDIQYNCQLFVFLIPDILAFDGPMGYDTADMNLVV